jgi:sugar phosphate isomerase/epimerase
MITRRSFLRCAGLASAAGVLPLQQQRTYKMGLQLFTMRAALSSDVAGTMKRIATLGYEEVETYGFDPKGIGYYGMPAKAFAQLLRDSNLTTPSGHYDLNRFVTTTEDELKRYMDRCIEGAQALRQAYITWPLIDPESRTIEGFRAVARRLNLIGKQAKAAGLLVAYHNHDFEFIEHNGQIGYDIILKETDPALVKLQMDLYWIARASKASASEWFKQQPGRFVMWHVKDMHKTSRDYTELGNGTVDFSQIFPHARLAGLQHYFVEQGGNFTHDPFRSITDGAEYMKRMPILR